MQKLATLKINPLLQLKHVLGVPMHVRQFTSHFTQLPEYYLLS